MELGAPHPTRHSSEALVHVRGDVTGRGGGTQLSFPWPGDGGSCCYWPRLRKQAGGTSSRSGSLEQTSRLLHWRRRWRGGPWAASAGSEGVQGPSIPTGGISVLGLQQSVAPKSPANADNADHRRQLCVQVGDSPSTHSSLPRSTGHVNLFAPTFEPHCCKYLNMKSWLTAATYKGDLFHIGSSEIFFWTI